MYQIHCSLPGAAHPEYYKIDRDEVDKLSGELFVKHAVNVHPRMMGAFAEWCTYHAAIFLVERKRAMDKCNERARKDPPTDKTPEHIFKLARPDQIEIWFTDKHDSEQPQ